MTPKNHLQNLSAVSKSVIGNLVLQVDTSQPLESANPRHLDKMSGAQYGGESNFQLPL